jgi:uncharacterized protein (TIGR02594 family)
MAINFGNTIMEGGIEPSVRVQNPVQDDSGAVLANSLAPVAQFVGQAAGSIFKAQQQNATSKILTSYENDLLNLADAVDQESMTRNEAMIHARNLRRQYLGNSPDLQADFDKIWTNFATANGLGHVVVEGTIQSQAEDAINLEAAKLGYTRGQYDVVRARARELQAVNDQFDLVSKSNGIITESMKAKGLQAVIGVADAAYPSAKSQIDTAMQQMNANPAQRGPIAQQTITSIKSQLASIESGALGAETDFITKPINDLLKTFEDWSNNTIESSVLENQIEFVQLQYDAMYTKDPILGPFIAQSALLKSAGLESSVIAQKLLNDEVITALRDATDPTKAVNILSDTTETNKIVQAITEAAGANLDEAGIEEMKQFLAGIVDGAYQNERVNQDGALGYKGTIEMLGSPEMTEFIKTNGGLPAKYSDEFVAVIKSNYETEFLPVVQRYWESVPITDPTTIGATGPEGNTAGITNLPMSQLLDVVWNGSAVEFIPKQEWASNPRVQSLANEVNSGNDSIGVPLNNLINAHANVAGVEAKTIWEQDFANQIFNLEAQAMSESANQMLDATAQPETNVMNIETGITEPDQLNVNASDLTLEDFNPDPEVAFEQITRTVENTQASDPMGVVNATNPVSFAQAFIGMREDNAQDQQVLSSFIRKTAGISINPAQTAWCAAFVDAILNASGQGAGTGKLNARSYLNWGVPVSTPQEGDVVVMSRGSDQTKGHVGFYAGMTSDGRIRVLGGNQGNSVSIANFNASTVLGYRRAN